MTMSDTEVFLSWDLGNGDFSGLPEPATSYEAGTYNVELVSTTSFGCADTATAVVNVLGVAGTFTAEPTVICKGQEVTFTLMDTVDVTSWIFDFGDGTTLENQNPATHVYGGILDDTEQIVAQLILDGANGCRVSDSLVLDIDRVIAAFEVGEIPDSTFCPTTINFVNNSSSNATMYEWDFGDDMGTSQEENPEYLYEGQGGFDVSLVVLNDIGCRDTTTERVVVRVQPLEDIKMPKAFTPNGDDINNFFRPAVSEELLEQLLIEDFRIWRRWNGKVVYDNTNGSQGWDGRENGTQSPAEVYYYIIRMTVEGCDLNIRFEGDVTLLG